MSDWQGTMEALVRDRERALVSYAYMVCGNADHAQDLVQDALVRTFSRPRPALSAVKAEAYVRRAITTIYIDHYRRAQRWQRVQHLFRPGASVEDIATGVDMSNDVASALQQLSPRERACLVLRFFDDMSVRDISSTLGIAEGTVKRYLSDGVRAMEHHLGPLKEDTAAYETDDDAAPSEKELS